MPLSNLHKLSKEEYLQKITDHLKPFENALLSIDKTGFDAVFEGTSIAMGYGHDLLQNVQTLEEDLKDVATLKGVHTYKELKAYIVKQLDFFKKIKTEMKEAKDKGIKYEISDVYKEKAKSIAAKINERITLTNETNAETLLKNDIDKFDKKLDAKLNEKLKGYKLEYSEERVGVLGQVYRLGIGAPKSMYRAIISDDRAEAWFEIRYNSDSHHLTGNYKRVIAESNFFHLYHDSDISKKEAMQIMAMCKKHKSEIDKQQENSTKYAEDKEIMEKVKKAAAKLGYDVEDGSECYKKAPPKSQKAPDAPASSAPFGARADSKYELISCAPSVNKTQVGNAVVPVPYPVNEKLDKAKDVSKDVMLNAKGAYTKKSNSNSVKGDEQGKLGGVVSATVGEKSEPSMSSTSVNVNGSPIVRAGDLHKMQGGNTIGKLTTQESGSGSSITDEGVVQGETAPEDFDPSSMNETQALSEESSTTKPTATADSGALGSRSGSPVLLKTGQLIHKREEIRLWGRTPLKLEHTYISRDSFLGMFGASRRCVYEKRFVKQDKNNYKLYLDDGRKFDFVKQERGFTDIGKLGVTVTELTDEEFILVYSDARLETYHKEKLICCEDANANAITLMYDSRGKMRRVVNSDGSWFEFEYDKQGLAIKVIDFAKRSWTFDYDSEKNLSRVTNPLGGKTRFYYQSFKEGTKSHSLLVEVKDELENPTLQVSYDKELRVKSYKQKELSYSYDYLNARMIAKTDNEGNILNYGLDEHGLINAITFSDGSTSKEEYDENTRTAIVIDQGANVTLKAFDENNRLIQEIDQTQNETFYAYEGNNPYPISIIKNEKETKYVYDNRFNLVEIQSPDGKSQSFEYDHKGNPTKIIDAMGNATSVEYDSDSHLVKLIDPLGAVTSFGYDKAGRQTLVIDANAHKTMILYDKMDNVLSVTDAQGNATSFTYDKTQNLSSATDPTSNTTSYKRDKFGRVVKQSKADGRFKHYEYNADDTLRSMTHEDGCVTLYQRDKAKRIVAMEYANSSVHYEYDSMGNLLLAQDENSRVQRHYDAHAKVTIQTLHDVDVDKLYDEKNQALLHLRVMEHDLWYDRDESGLATKIKTTTSAIELSYDDNGILKERRYLNEQSEILSYDKAYNLSKIQTAQKEFDYSYDATGQVIAKNDAKYAYDEIGRLTDSPNEMFAYDAAGNNLNDEAKYNQKNYQLQETKTHAFTYDARGNQREKLNKQTKETTLYDFNSKNQLSKVVSKDARGVVTSVLEFVYDALDRRISKTRDGVTRHYLYDDANIVAILDEDKRMLASIVHPQNVDTPLSITTYDNESKLTPVQESYFNSLSEEDKEFLLEQSRQRIYYYHRDHQGSIIALTDEEGVIVESYIYDESYGKILDRHKSIETHNPYAYASREFDSEDLYYYRARYYDPQTQRFLSEDPIEFLSGDFNWYRYVGNNPVNFTDPSGLIFFIPVLIGIGEFIASYGVATVVVGATAARVAPMVYRVASAAPKVIKSVSRTNVIPKGAVATDQAKVEEEAQEEQKSKTEAASSVQAGEGAKVKGEAKEKKKSDCGDSSKNKGDCAERLVDEKYKKEGYKKFDTKRLENKSGHGVDNIATKNGETVIIETKANTSRLSKSQNLGGKKYLEKQLKAMEEGLNGDGGRWKSFEGDEDFKNAIKDLKKQLKNKLEYKICRVKLEEDSTGCYGKEGNGKCKGEVKCEKEWNKK